jgi:hypothetical protein
LGSLIVRNSACQIFDVDEWTLDGATVFRSSEKRQCRTATGGKQSSVLRLWVLRLCAEYWSGKRWRSVSGPFQGASGRRSFPTTTRRRRGWAGVTKGRLLFGLPLNASRSSRVVALAQMGLAALFAGDHAGRAGREGMASFLPVLSGDCSDKRAQFLPGS